MKSLNNHRKTFLRNGLHRLGQKNQFYMQMNSLIIIQEKIQLMTTQIKTLNHLVIKTKLNLNQKKKVVVELLQ